MDLWFVYIAVFSQQFQLSGLFLILPLFLSDEFGYSDTESGALFGGIGVTLAVYSVGLGTIIDKIGVKYSAMAAGFITVLACVPLVLAQEQQHLVVPLVLILPFGGAMAIPAGKIAPRRYTTEETRPLAYSLFFASLMLAQFVAYGVDDAIIHGSNDTDPLSKYR